jgi:hypothetical protein
MLGTAGWLFLLSGVATAAPPSAVPLSIGQVAALVRALDTDDFSAREAAGRQLVAAGEPAIAALAEGVTSSSPEVAWRSSMALEQIALSGSEATLNQVAAQLQRLIISGKPGLAAMQKDLVVKHTLLRRDRAMARVRSLGGKFSSDGDPSFSVDDAAMLGVMFGGIVPPLIIGPEEAAIGIEVAVIDELPTVAENPAVAGPAEPIVGPAPPPDEPPPAVEPREALDSAIAEAFVEDVVAVDVAFPVETEAIPSESLTLDKSWHGGDAGVASLRDVPRLVSLSIDHAPLTDAALSNLATLPNLAELDVCGTSFTSAGLYKFRERQPATRVYAIGTAMLGVNAQHHGKCELTGVYQGSGAFEAGLRTGDEIIAVDGRPLRDFGDLTIAVFTRKPGEKLKIDYRRSGQQYSTEVTLKERKGLESR